MRSRMAGLILLIFGALMLASSFSNPRIEALHGADIVRLTGIGACFGVALVSLIGRLKITGK